MFGEDDAPPVPPLYDGTNGVGLETSEEAEPDGDLEGSNVLGRRLVAVATPIGQSHARRALVALVVLICLAAAGYGSAQLFAGPAPGRAASNPGSTRAPGTSLPAKSTTTTALAGLPTEIAPATTSAATVSYQLALSGSFQVSVAASGVCWVGVEQSVGGAYLSMKTLAGGETMSYLASGTIVVRLGAPNVASMSVNGVPVELPSGRTQPYNVVLSESA